MVTDLAGGLFPSHHDEAANKARAEAAANSNHLCQAIALAHNGVPKGAVAASVADGVYVSLAMLPGHSF